MDLEIILLCYSIILLFTCFYVPTPKLMWLTETLLYISDWWSYFAPHLDTACGLSPQFWNTQSGCEQI